MSKSQNTGEKIRRPIVVEEVSYPATKISRDIQTGDFKEEEVFIASVTYDRWYPTHPIDVVTGIIEALFKALVGAIVATPILWFWIDLLVGDKDIANLDIPFVFWSVLTVSSLVLIIRNIIAMYPNISGTGPTRNETYSKTEYEKGGLAAKRLARQAQKREESKNVTESVDEDDDLEEDSEESAPEG